MFVCYCSHLLEVCHIAVRVAECLGKDSLCVRLYGSLQSIEVVDADDSVADTLVSQCVCNKVIAAAIQIVCCYDVVTCLQDVLQSISDSCCSRCYSKSCYTTLKGCHTILKDALSRVCQTSVDVACVSQAKTVCCMLAVVEYVTGGLIDWHST